MKKLIFATALLVSCLSIKIASAQVHFSIGVNIGAQPDWGPVGYDHVDYYYIPDVDAYYDVPAHQYVYYSNNVWVHRAYLPTRYRNYDVYHGYKVVVNEREPWRNHREIRTKYASYRGRRDQEIIRNSHDEKYAKHWHHDNGRHEGERRGNGKGHGNDHDRGHGHGNGHN